MGRRSVKEPRQKEIIKGFYKLAKKEGLENASIAKTAEIVGVNPSLIMHYFKSKEHLVYGLVEYILDKYLLIYNVRKNKNDSSLDVLIKVTGNIFSNKWNTLFDDGVSYSCYSLTFRNKIIKNKYKNLLDTLRKYLQELILQCVKEGHLMMDSAEEAADIIFVLVDGAYYYLTLTDDKKEYSFRLERYKTKAYDILGIHP